MKGTPFLWLGIAILFIFGALISMSPVPFLYVGFGIGLFLITVFLFINFRAIYAKIRFFTVTAALLIALVVLNIFGASIIVIYDATLGSVNTLSDAEAKVIRSIPEGVVVSIFPTADRIEQVRWLTTRIAKINPKITILIQEYEKNREKAENVGVIDANQAFVAAHGKKFLIASFSKAELLKTLVQSQMKKSPRICFSTGDGERTIDDTSKKGINLFASYTKAVNNVELKTISLYQSVDLPSVCDTLFVVGPSQALPGEAVAMIDRFVGAKGNLVLFADPGFTNGLEPLVAGYGITLADEFVIDPNSSAGQSALVPIISKFTESPLTQEIANKSMNLVLSLVRPVSKTTQTLSVVSSTELFFSSESSWAKHAINNGLNFSEGLDRKGPFPLAVWSILSGGGNVLVVGDSEMVSNQLYPLSANPLFLQKIIDTIVMKDSPIKIAERSFRPHTLMLTYPQSKWIFFGLVILFPLLFIGGAAYFSYRNKRL